MGCKAYDLWVSGRGIGGLGIGGTEAMLGQLGLQAILDQEFGGNTGLSTAGDSDVVSGCLMRLTCVVERF